MALLLRRMMLSKPLTFVPPCVGASACNINTGFKNYSDIYININRRKTFSRDNPKFSTIRGPTTESVDLRKIMSKEESSVTGSEEVPMKNGINDWLIDVESGMKSMGPARVVAILTSLSKLAARGEVDPDELKSNAKFQKLCESFEKHCKDINHVLLVNGVRSILELKLEPESKLVSSLENELLWQTRRMNLKALSICLSFHVNHQETDLQKKVVQEVISLIKKRWIEINDTLTILKMFEISSKFNEEFLCKLEDRALDLTDKMTLNELQKLLSTLAQRKRRPTPLLRSISYHVNQKPEKLTLKQNIDFLYALNMLNFPDVALLQRISNDLIPDINETTKKNTITSILTCCGRMKWKHPGLLEACTQWILNKPEECRPQEYVACLLALARVDYQPEDADKLFETINQNLHPEKLTSLIWLDVVWSLCLLSRANENHVSSIMKPSFFEPLLRSIASHNPNIKYKLQNIYAVIKTEFPTVKLQMESVLSKLEEITTVSSDIKSGKESVLDALNNFVPRGKFLATNLVSNFGFVIDAEFIIDQKGNPIPIIEYGIKNGGDHGIKPLPKGCQRIALLIWDFKDLTLNSSNLTGASALAVRILGKHSYSVIEVLLQEFNTYSTTVKKVQFLQQKIKEKVKDSSK